jgi:hypothetical protein
MSGRGEKLFSSLIHVSRWEYGVNWFSVHGGSGYRVHSLPGSSSRGMIIVTIDDHNRDLSRVFEAGIFLGMMVIAFGDVTSPRAPDRESSFNGETRLNDTAAV